MTRLNRCFALLLLVLPWARLGTSAETTAESGIEQAVLETHHKMTAAANGLDAEGFFAFILDSAKGPVIQDGRLLATRAEALEVVKQGFEGVAKVERVYETTHVTVISEKAALLTGEGTSTVTLEDGRSFGGRFAVSVVFVQKDGDWKMLHGHYSVPNRP